jgi:hypothetical protein
MQENNKPIEYKNSDDLEDEFDAIRIALYEETKGMSPQELNDYVHAQIVSFDKKHKLNYLSDRNKSFTTKK